jgi:hypothetical protein
LLFCFSFTHSRHDFTSPGRPTVQFGSFGVQLSASATSHISRPLLPAKGRHRVRHAANIPRGGFLLQERNTNKPIPPTFRVYYPRIGLPATQELARAVCIRPKKVRPANWYGSKDRVLRGGVALNALGCLTLPICSRVNHWMK